MRFEVVSRLSTEGKSGCFCEKKLKKRIFRPSAVTLTLLYGETEEKQRHQRHDKTMSAVKKLIPLMDRVLVERAVAATKTSGGILLPETVGSKVRRMNSHSHSSLSSLVFFLWISILVCLSERERERERSTLGGRSLLELKQRMMMDAFSFFYDE